MQNVAGLMVEQLATWGVQRVYGVVGDANLYFLDALQRHPGISFIQTRHEAAAAMMASAEAKLTGRVGVCTATSGPGMVNLLNGLADAYADQVPVLAITGQVSSDKLGFPVKQQIDQQLMIQPLACWSSLLAKADKATELTWLGLHYAETKGGVSHISIPKDLWSQTANQMIKSRPVLEKTSRPDPEVLQAVAKEISEAQKPVLMVGRGITGMEEQVLALAERRGIPVITTLPAKGLIPEKHPLSLGGLGQAGTEAATNIIKQADLILILGATWWPKGYINENTAIIQFDAYKPNLVLKHPAVKTFYTQLDEVIPVLVNMVNNTTNQDWLQTIAQEREKWFSRIEEERHNLSEPVSPQYVMAQLEKYIPADAIIVLDVGDHVIWFDRCYWGTNKDLLISGTWRTMAFGLPAAIAAQLVYPQRQVFLITGDGGLTMGLSELITARQHHTAVKVVVINNGSLAMEENRAEVAGLLKDSSKLLNPDFVGVAQACGWQASKVNKPQELAAALTSCLESQQPYLIDVECSIPQPPNTKA